MSAALHPQLAPHVAEGFFFVVAVAITRIAEVAGDPEGTRPHNPLLFFL